MIHDKLLPGLCIKWDIPNPIPYRKDELSKVKDNVTPTPPMTCDGLAGELNMLDPKFQSRTPASLGLSKGTSVPYRWLDYAPANLARIAMGGTDVLTGRMSGCPIITWTDARGSWVGHVGTLADDVETNKKVKALTLNTIPDNARGFNPAGAWTGAEFNSALARFRASKATRPNPNVSDLITYVALVTRSGHFFTLMLGRHGTTTSEYVILGNKRVPAMNAAQLRTWLAP